MQKMNQEGAARTSIGLALNPCYGKSSEIDCNPLAKYIKGKV